jgi:hypothetical protein
LRALNQPERTTPVPSRQRIADASLINRLEASHKRNRELAGENNALRRQLSQALGHLRAASNHRDPGNSAPMRS